MKLILCLLTVSLFGADPAWVREFDSIAKRGLEQLRVPGAAIGLIQDGKVVLAKGYGVRDQQTNQHVTPRTLFALGSVSKSFTAAVVASVIDDGKLSWDRPVREFVPWFKMYDPVATELINVRDMLTHRSGLPRHDFIRFSTHLSREELVRRIRHMEPNHTFREVYQYNNLMFVTAGYVAGLLSGSTWEDLVRDRIFVPVGMSRSNTSSKDMQRSDDFAKPHSRGREVDFYNYQEFGVGPNGAVNSCVDDLLKYLQMWLDNGQVNGKQIISKEQMAELKRPVTVVNATASYAPGWQMGFHRGERIISHGGSITGFRAHAIMLPNHRAGIVAMINAETPLAGLLAETMAEFVAGMKPRDYLAEMRGTAPGTRAAPQQVSGTKPSKQLTEYAGTYFHPAYGNVRVEASGDELQVKFDALSMALKHFHYDTFQTDQGMSRFVLNSRGDVSELHLPLEAAVKPFVFVKRPVQSTP
jgi:CubicO group peptidase (beta-lactamase class C family)